LIFDVQPCQIGRSRDKEPGLLSRIRKIFRKDGVQSLPHYRAIFIAAFLVAELAILSVEGYYLLTGEDTFGFLIVDALLFTAVAAILLLISYYLVGRVFTAFLESQGRFEALVNNSPDTIYYLNGGGRIEWVNEAGLKFFGYGTMAQVKGKSFGDFIHPEDREETAAAFREALRSQQATVAGLTFRMLKKDGGVVWAELHAHTMFDEDGNYRESVGIIRDVTRRKRYEDALEKANAELEVYAHTVSHDLKNPIQTVMLACGGVQTLAGSGENGDSAEMLVGLADAAIAGAQRANRLIEDLLLFAESGQVPKDVCQVEVSEKVREVLSEKESDISERGIRVRMDADMGQVVAAPTHIYQLFANLVTNAIRYNDSRHPEIEIKYFSSVNGDGHRYLVRDNGSGIPSDLLDSVFVPFSRGKNGETGIGLSIVEKIVKVYGGSIEAYNEGGACFEFTLHDAQSE
jgi:PAS domain S-box-containing protein